MKLYDIIGILEKEFPKTGAYDWDNVGLLVGDEQAEIKKVLVSLDVTEAVIAEAITSECDLVLSHHPILFSGIKQINTDTADGRIILSAIKNNINIYAAHTNCDVAPMGINAYLADILALTDAEPLEESGLGRIGTLKKECTLSEFSKLLKEALNLDFVRVCGDEIKKIKTVAIGSGACSDSIPYAIQKGADVMVTGDTKYHNMLDFSKDIAIIDAGHYGTEIVICDIFEKLLTVCPIEIIRTKSMDVYKIM